MAQPPLQTQNVRTFSQQILDLAPAWMMNRPGFAVFAKYLFVMGNLVDVGVQAALEGVRAAFPGYDGRTDNFPLLAQARGLIQGETETSASFAARLRNWLVTAQDMGGDVGLALQIHYWLGNNPRVRIWSRNGRCTTVNTDGTVSQVSGVMGGWSGPGELSGYGLNWDSISNPERAQYWWDNWIVVYPDEFPATGTFGARTGGNVPMNNPSLGIGHLCTRLQVSTIRGLVYRWKGQHIVVRWVIFTTDQALFNPANPGYAGNPNGKWGTWGYFNGTSTVTNLNSACRFWGPNIY